MAPPKNKTKLGETLEELRKLKGLSGRRLGEESGVHYTVISWLEKGQCVEPSAIKLVLLAEALDVPYTTLIDATIEDANIGRRRREIINIGIAEDEIR